MEPVATIAADHGRILSIPETADVNIPVDWFTDEYLADQSAGQSETQNDNQLNYKPPDFIHEFRRYI
jgi:hypothetical protein